MIDGAPSEPAVATGPRGAAGSTAPCATERHEERVAIARFLHDGPAQSLTYLLHMVQLAERAVEGDPGAAQAELARVHALLRQTLDEVIGALKELRRAP